MSYSYFCKCAKVVKRVTYCRADLIPHSGFKMLILTKSYADIYWLNISNFSLFITHVKCFVITMLIGNSFQ